MAAPDGHEQLPAAYIEARTKDEAFWEAQEQRIQGRAGQPCCTLSGISTGLMALHGRFAVIVHGEDECAACFFHTGPSAPQFFCTGLTEQHFVLGETRGPLEKCLRVVARDIAPEAIFVLGACPVEVIGDRFEIVVADIQGEFPDVPMVALHTHGLRVGSQAAMLDWMFSTLAALPSRMAKTAEPEPPRIKEALLSAVKAVVKRDSASWDEARAHYRGQPMFQERSINLLGFPRGRWGHRLELDSFLEGHDVAITALPGHATLEEWRNATQARATFAFDRGLYPKLIEALEGAGSTVVDVDIPVGIEASRSFYADVGSRLGLADVVAAASREPEAQAREAVAAFRRRHGGMRMAMGLRLGNNYHADHIGRMGLGDFQFLSECGFTITLLVQGPPEKHERFAVFFRDNGIDQPFVMFPEPWTISQWLDGDRYDIAYLLDHCRGEADKAGVPMIASREFEQGFAGVAENIRYLERALQGSPRAR